MKKGMEEFKKKFGGFDKMRGKIFHNIVKHDNECDIFKNKRCSCNPEVEVLSDNEYKARFENVN